LKDISKVQYIRVDWDEFLLKVKKRGEYHISIETLILKLLLRGDLNLVDHRTIIENALEFRQNMNGNDPLSDAYRKERSDIERSLTYTKAINDSFERRLTIVEQKLESLIESKPHSKY
jgi:hypothetical protein